MSGVIRFVRILGIISVVDQQEREWATTIEQARLPTVSELAGTVHGLLLVVIQNQVAITTNQIELRGTIMSQSEQLGADIAQVKTDVANATAAAQQEIQQVMDALTTQAQQATDLAAAKQAMTEAHAQLQSVHQSLGQMTTDLQADDPATPV